MKSRSPRSNPDSLCKPAFHRRTLLLLRSLGTDPSMHNMHIVGWMHCWTDCRSPAHRMKPSASACSTMDSRTEKAHWSASRLHSQTRNSPTGAPVQILKMHPSGKQHWRNKYHPENSSVVLKFP